MHFLGILFNSVKIEGVGLTAADEGFFLLVSFFIIYCSNNLKVYVLLSYSAV